MVEINPALSMRGIWARMIDMGYNTRKTKANGLAIWQIHKAEYSRHSNTKIPLNPAFIDFVKKLNYRVTTEDHTDVILNIVGFQLDNRIETEHFFIQHFRIPIMENFELSFVKIAQLAYNIGQARAVMELEKYYNPELVQFYVKHKLDDIMTYFQLSAPVWTPYHERTHFLKAAP
jgi:hypothetical protein